MQILNTILIWLEGLAQQLPLMLFVPIGSFLEEIIAPIPSPLVMVLAGSLSEAQKQPLLFVLLLAAAGALAKTFGSWIYYVLSDKLEDVVIGKFGKFIGVTHKQIESIGAKLNGGWQDNVFLFLSRALPIIPSAPVSVACGIIKINMRTYLSSTFFGNFVRNLIYLYLGFAGVENYKQVVEQAEGAESIGKIILFVVVAGVVVYAYWKRSRVKHEE